ncbi:hypothetical protein QWA68_007156 [Fusarium oxysporum]|nr:hypothetical protein QWA68_007156 [Fusarium oxysporum]
MAPYGPSLPMTHFGRKDHRVDTTSHTKYRCPRVNAGTEKDRDFGGLAQTNLTNVFAKVSVADDLPCQGPGLYRDYQGADLARRFRTDIDNVGGRLEH